MIYISFDIGVKNLALCVLDHDGDSVSIVDWNVICLTENKTLKGIDKISRALYSELDRIVGSLQAIGIDHIGRVIIENQPSNLNGIMKTIQFLIYSYFDLSRHWNEKVGEVLLINPAFKLQNHEFVPTRIEKKQAEQAKKVEPAESTKPAKQANKATKMRNERYRNNKRDGIEVCRHYIKDDKHLLGFFESHKKKDDLADTCIQTISYLRKQGHKIDCISLAEINFFVENCGTIDA